MAKDVLNEVMSGKITWDAFEDWLNPTEKTEQYYQFECSQRDFVIYFLNLLRDEVSSILHYSTGRDTTKKSNTSLFEDERRLNCSQSDHVISSSNAQDTGQFSKQDAMQTPNRNFGKNVVINVSKCKQESNIVYKSVDSNSKHSLKCSSIVKDGTILGQDSQNTFCKSKQIMTISPVQKCSDITYLSSCHLSPIPSELYPLRKEKQCGFGFETVSPHNKTLCKDKGSKIRTPFESNSGPSSSTPQFNISEHIFPTVGSPARQNSSRRRRIKPTRLADSFETGKSEDQNRVPNFGEVVRPLEQSILFRDDVTNSEKKENAEENFRNLLRLEKQKLQQNAWTVSMAPKTVQVASNLPISPSPEVVKFKDKLCILVKIYHFLIENNLICNIVTEMHFVLSLLNVQEESDTSCSKSRNNTELGYFVSIHECVYFASAVLNGQRFFLSTLDKASLKLLLNNKRISLFVPDLRKYLYDLYLTRKDTTSPLHSSVFHSSVCFQSETDNRENFPNDRTFVTFRKQRDSFYEILGVWEDNHNSPGWSFGVALGPRVRSLLCLNAEPANFIHFARLFRTQLLGSYWKSSNAVIEDEPNGAVVEVLKCLKEGNPSKYSRLHERLVTPFKSSNSYTSPSFPHQQEFYKDFIVSGCHAVFNAHLVDSFWHEIVSLNSSNFTASEVEAGTVDKDTKEEFLECVKNLQLLAKFLGFVLFLPYHTNNKHTDLLIEKHMSLRLKVTPPTDVLTCVQEAIQLKKLVLTIPWVTHFLSMMDNVSCNLPYYQEVISLLVTIYQTLPSESSHYSLYGSFMLKACLGWLFEQPQLPEGFFYNFCLKKHPHNEPIVNSEDSRNGIDGLDLIELESLLSLCPNLEIIKWLLITDTNNIHNVVPPRHITPVLVTQEHTVSSSSTRNLELQLEENFLECQPPSLRKTIEFVSERIASSCVKFICGKPLKDIKEKALQMLNSSFESEYKEVPEKKIPLEVVLSQELKKYCQNRIPKVCLEKCRDVMPLLLEDDIAEEIKDVCVQISVRMSLERVNIWINSHITPGLFSKHLSSEIDKVYRKSNKSLKASHVISGGWRDTSEDKAASPAEAIVMCRNFVCRVRENLKVKNEDVQSVLKIVVDTLHARRDLIPSAERVLGMLSVDLAFALLAHQPELMEEKLLKTFLNVWTTKEVVSSHCFLHLICPRNIMILNYSIQPERTWLATAQFLQFLLKNNIVPPQEIETQSVAIFRQEWPSETLRNLALCFEDVVKHTQHGNASDQNFVLLLELITDLCQELQNEDY